MTKKSSTAADQPEQAAEPVLEPVHEQFPEPAPEKIAEPAPVPEKAEKYRFIPVGTEGPHPALQRNFEQADADGFVFKGINNSFAVFYHPSPRKL